MGKRPPANPPREGGVAQDRAKQASGDERCCVEIAGRAWTAFFAAEGKRKPDDHSDGARGRRRGASQKAHEESRAVGRGTGSAAVGDSWGSALQARPIRCGYKQLSQGAGIKSRLQT